mgnify:CR=1 FL=1
MFFISTQKRANRLEICRNCEHYIDLTRSCGTLGIGSEVKDENDESVKLCGCVMPIKTRLKIASCPLKKWTSEISRKDIDIIKSILKDVDGVTSISHQQNEKLTEMWNKATGSKKKVSSCNSCVRKMITELTQFIKDDE